MVSQDWPMVLWSKKDELKFVLMEFGVESAGMGFTALTLLYSVTHLVMMAHVSPFNAVYFIAYLTCRSYLLL